MTDDPIPCPGCGARLRVPRNADPEAVSFTCPRCLAAVPRPAPTTFSEDAPLSRPEPADAPSLGERRCPACSARVGNDWVSCPECGEPLDRARRRSGGLDRDVRLDQRGIGVGTVLLATLGGVALVGSLLYTAGAVVRANGPEDVVRVMVFVGLPLAVFLVALNSHWPKKEGLVALGVIRALATCGTVVGVLLGLAGALLILLFAVCYAGGGPKF